MSYPGAQAHPIVPALVAAAVIAFIAALPMPYGYYQFTRLAVTAVATWSIFVFVEHKRPGWSVAMGAMALLFNPIVKIHLEKSVWMVADIVAGVVMLCAAAVLATHLKRRT